MRIHTDKLTRGDLVSADKAGAYFAGLTEHGSRKRDHAFEVKLRGDSKRRPNFYDGGGDYAATWDQWGVFFGELFRIDPNAIIGPYDGADDYSHKTFGRFDEPGMPEDAHGDHVFRFAGTPREQSCKRCTARFTWAS